MGPSEELLPGLRRAIDGQASHCRSLGAPFTAMLVEALAPALGGRSPVARAARAWPGDPLTDALTLRIVAGLNAFVRARRLPELAALFPPAPLPAAEVLADAVTSAVVAGGEELLAWLAGPPQTNEAGRAAAFMAAHLLVAARTGLPATVLELGASAGLNLIFDRYAHDLGGVRAGDTTSPLRLAPAWEGPPPPSAAVRVAARRGVDRAPLSLADAQARARLAAYVWPDHRHRLERLELAFAVAAPDPPVVEEGDAADWLEAVLPALPAQGLTRVIEHSVAFGYFDAPAQARVTHLIEAAGARATGTSPIAWIALEHAPGLRGELELTLRQWPGGATERLAVTDGHLSRLRWLGGGRDSPQP